MATLVAKCPQVGQKPANLLSRMQSRTTIDVARTLFSNTLILDGPELQDWQITLQILRFELASETPEFPPDDGGRGGRDRAPLFAMPEEPPLGGGSCHPIWPEDPSGGGERHPSWPEDGGSGGEYFPLSLMPEEPGGKGSRALVLPVERPGTEDEVDDIAVFPQEPLEDEVRPTRMALVWTFDGTNPGGGQQLVEVPYSDDGDSIDLNFQLDVDLVSSAGIITFGTKGSGKSNLMALGIEQCSTEILLCGGDGYHNPEAPGGAGND